jgi:hypothetical protein
MLNSGSSMDAVKKPGVITSPTGSLTLNGKAVAIYIDGAPSTLSGTDLQNYLSTLPAGAIEKVELIYNPGGLLMPIRAVQLLISSRVPNGSRASTRVLISITTSTNTRNRAHRF